MLSDGTKSGRELLTRGNRIVEESYRGRTEQDAAIVVRRLCGLLLEEGDEVVAVLGLLETAEGHLGAGNVLLGVLEVLEL